MKLKEIAEKAIAELKRHEDKGINNTELAKLIGTSKRRVYDVIAILKAASLIKTEREGSGTQIIWTYGEGIVQNSPQQVTTASRVEISTTGNIFNIANFGKKVIIEFEENSPLTIESIQ